MGRKPLSDAPKKLVMKIRLTGKEFLLLRTAAEVIGQAVSSWARELLLAEAGKIKPARPKKRKPAA